MNKKLLLIGGIGILVATALFIGYRSYTKSFSPEAVAEFSHDSLSVRVKYCRPARKGRLIFGRSQDQALVPYGRVWRTGANEATEITFKKDAMFGGKPVKAGTYSLYSIPGEKEWTVILNPELKQWGAFGYDKVKAKNVAEVTVPTKMYATSAEKLMFDVKDDSKLKFQWDKMGFEVPITYSK